MVFPAEIELSELNGSNGFALNGIRARDFSGFSVSGAGDVNGDGIDDLIIGAFGADPNRSASGQSYVVFGSQGGFDATVELSSLDGSNGFALNGMNALDFSGGSVSGAGDVNGDGIDDLIIGAIGADANGSASGQSYVVFGSQGGFDATVELSSLDGSNGFALNGMNVYDNSGTSVSGAGDVNGDGIDDLIIGAIGAAPNGTFSGQSYLVFGSQGGFDATVELSSLEGSNGFALNGIGAYDNSGFSVSGAGDVNGDGIDDLIIGAIGAVSNALIGSGQSYVVFGSQGGFDATVELSSLDGGNGFALNGINAFDYSGVSVSGAGDVNGDGIADLIIGADGAAPNGTGSGQSYVVFGSQGGFDATVELSSLDGSNGFTLNGISTGDSSGRSVSGAGDVNGDGIDDMIIGAPDADPNGDLSGRSYLVFGNEGGFDATVELSSLDGSNGFALNGINASDRSGFSVSGAGDVNGDGIADLIIGANDASPNGERSGQSYVVFGGTGDGDDPQTLRGTFRDDTLTGGLGDDTILGLFGNDSLSGLAGNDSINGAGGSDTLTGGPGEDTLVGGFGPDLFLFETPSDGVDSITDFRTRSDLIGINSAEFDNFGTPLTSGNLPPELFAELGSVTSEAVFVYDRSAGELFYRTGDSNSPESIQLADLRPRLNLNSTNFLIV